MIAFGRKGGLIISSADFDTADTGWQFCVFPGNRFMWKGKRSFGVFWIGFSFARS